jgi:hypothetical protein
MDNPVIIGIWNAIGDEPLFNLKIRLLELSSGMMYIILKGGKGLAREVN